jgi:nucleoside-diphosphate-sugar epimerase
MEVNMTRTALVLGAHGRFGGHVATALESAGWEVRRFDRRTDRLPDAAMGADLIVNGWNPPYPDWAATLPGLIDQVITAGRASGATILQACNVYVYGEGAPEVLTPRTPHRATNPLGRLRIDMETRLSESGVPVILLRAGDFIDTAASGNWFDRVIAKDATKGLFSYPGNAEIPHAWAYLPDLAAAAAVLADARESLPKVCEVLFPGHTLTGRELCDALRNGRSGDPSGFDACRCCRCTLPSRSGRWRADWSRCPICGRCRTGWSTRGCGGCCRAITHTPHRQGGRWAQSAGSLMSNQTRPVARGFGHRPGQR